MCGGWVSRRFPRRRAVSQTEKNLKEAFAGESQANRKYTAFARKAEVDKFPMVARLFRAAAEAEAVHAVNHLEVLKGIGSTLDNLKAASEGEAAEFRRMYPEFIKQAAAEGHKDARRSFVYANAVEEIHYDLYNRAIEAVQKGKDLPMADIYVCQCCGNTVEGSAPDKCPVCGAPRKMFRKID
jgi:rubrerythrin